MLHLFYEDDQNQNIPASRALGPAEFDQHNRTFQRIRGQRAHYIDYTLLLHNDEATLKPYICVADTTAKDVFFLGLEEWVDQKEGVVYAPSHVEPKLNGDGLRRLCDHFLEEKIPMSTTHYYFESRQRKIVWRPYPLKGVYGDFGE